MVNFPIKIPMTNKPVLLVGGGCKIEYKHLEEELRKHHGVGEDQVLRQVVVEKDSLLFVFDEGEL